MKRNVLFFALFSLFVAGSFTSCTQAPNADKAKTSEPKEAATPVTEAVAMKVDTEKSMVTWVGTKPVGKHNGTIKLKSGSLSVKDKTVEGGNFVIDMTTLVALDQDEEGNTKLAGHLKSKDFFEVETHPEAKFEVTGVTPYVAPADTSKKALLDGATHVVAGNLTMKGITKNVTFPAIINVSDAGLTAKANFNIDRTDWGLAYGADKSLGDRFIRPTVNVGLELTATK